MSEESAPKKSRNVKNGVKKATSSIKSFVKNPIAKKLLIVLLVVTCAYGIFFLGQQSGAKNQKAEDAKKVSSSTRPNPNSRTSSMNRKTFIGTISSIDNKTIEITPRSGNKVKVTISDTARITGSDAKQTDIKALKKDQKVIVSTTKDKDGKSYTATRIRIQR